MTADNNDPFLYTEQAETWQREASTTDRLRLVEQQLAAVIADNADLRRCLKYLSERAGIQADTLVLHHKRMIKMDTLLSQVSGDHSAKLNACNKSIAHLLNFETEHSLLHREKGDNA